MMKFYTLLLLLFTAVPSILCANILGLFPYPGKSHFHFIQPLMLGLAKAGHDVTVVSYFPNKQPVGNYTDLVLDKLPIIADIVNLNKIEKSRYWFREIQLPNFFVLNSLGFDTCAAALESDAINQILETTKKFDVILMEYFINDCMLAVSYKLKAPVIGLTSHALLPWHYKRMGSPFVPSFMPNHFLGHSNKMGFFQRMNNIVHHHLMNLFHDIFCQRPTNTMIEIHFGGTVPPIEELVLNTSVILVNQHFSVNGPTPYVPGIVEVGGLHIQDPQPLDAELKQILDGAKNGVIYVSFGSLVQPSTVSPDKRDALVNALSKFDSTILLKWPKRSIPNPPKNFYLRDWMPQRDILCHPNVKVFMTHGGQLGSTEGLYCGVSLVVIPLFGDQFLNAAAIEARNAGVILQYRDMQEEKIVTAIEKALTSRAEQHAKLISESFRNRPQTPLELSIWWVENVIRTKGAQLAVNASARMNWITYYNLDIYAVSMLLILIAFLIFKLQLPLCVYSTLAVILALLVSFILILFNSL